MAEAEQKVLSDLRKMIMEGAIVAGEKISEVSVSQMLGVSRTPAKFALARLEMTGLIEKLPGRGYAVCSVKLEDIEKIIQLRGVLEGSAAGHMAMHGMSEEARKAFVYSLSVSGAITKKGSATVQDIEDYQAVNTLFHETVMDLCGNDYIPKVYDRIRHLPMAELGAVVPDLDRLAGEFMRMSIGHAQHTIIYEAISCGDAMRAEMVMREHSHATLDYARLFVGKDAVDKSIKTVTAKPS
ncbi:GntR family transcriptional regulator [Phaeobacter sp. J2-8]|uniref:GntR family transcriptional regulator n=1 Tax=Phaeobacter sp. J2-8 TaxID=2931394 RepID=UPI001FD11F81|nr:GntR family transcriptional regulator [Phaeobacter sp. J2-8]MCJ7873466.1 GntR family transcriptional regulator [Phaeobacter sp. J2-8]